ncbi:MAG TPA: 30S ribosomal protein S21 [Candidatus Baltobacteraceae bacterium]|nr:30S ribosomal protein S21 [Candidatus Baltobacteraceae bacterium]
MRDGNGQEGPGAFGEGGAVRHPPLEVRVGERGLEGALRLFKKLVLKDGLLRDLKHRSHYEKPGDRRRRKARESLRRVRKQRLRALQRGEYLE